MSKWCYRALVIFFGIVISACSRGAQSSNGLLPFAHSPVSQSPASQSGPISHVVIVVQENRSFDNLFATYPNADGTTKGLLYDGHHFTLTERKLESGLILDNSWKAFVVDYNSGKMNGFNLVYVNEHKCTCAYQYVNPKDIKPYWSMAKHYVLGDHMFPTQASGSFTGTSRSDPRRHRAQLV